MMRKAEYEEKEFETLANATFVAAQRWSLAGIRIFSPGQVLEAALGFDVSTRLNPTSRLYKRLFGTHTTAPGAPAPGSIGLPVTRSTRLLNLFIQYKRPDLFEAPHRFSRLWNEEPFLRFEVRARKNGQRPMDQLEVLQNLEDRLTGQALVRYACPSGVSRQALYDSFGNHALLETVTFVRPSALRDAQRNHEFWTFQEKDLQSGKPNPDGERSPSEGGSEFLKLLHTTVEENSQDAGPRELLVSTAEKAHESHGGWPPVEPTAAEAKEDHEISVRTQLETEAQATPSEQDVILSALRIADLARQGDAVWTVVGAGDD